MSATDDPFDTSKTTSQTPSPSVLVCGDCVETYGLDDVAIEATISTKTAPCCICDEHYGRTNTYRVPERAANRARIAYLLGELVYTINRQRGLRNVDAALGLSGSREEASSDVPSIEAIAEQVPHGVGLAIVDELRTVVVNLLNVEEKTTIAITDPMTICQCGGGVIDYCPIHNN